jgi:hypothetical protein
MAKSAESKTGREQKLPTEPQRENATPVGPAAEPKAPRDNVSPLPGDNQGREVKAMHDEGNNVSKKLFEGFSDMTSKFLSTEDTRKIAKLWIENTEKAADELLKFQTKATEWSKNTMFAPLFEMQNSIARSCVEISAKTARRVWQLE